MTSFDLVTVGIDGSAHSEMALTWAARFAARHHCRIEPVYTWDYPTVTFMPPPFGWPVAPESSMQEAAEKAAGEILERWTAQTTRAVPLEAPVVVHGGPGPTLVEQSAESSLLVVGSRGMGTVKGLVLGSVSSYCAAHATCPVAIVPRAPTGEDRIDHVVVGHDGSARSDTALRWTFDAYPGAQIDLVHAWTPPVIADPTTGFDAMSYAALRDAAVEFVDTTVARFADEASAAGCTLTGEAAQGDARTELNMRAAEADLLVLGIQAEHGMRRAFLGSVAQSVVHHLTAATVVVPVGEE